MFGLIYILSEKELKILQKYLKKFLKKRFIKKSHLMIKYLIFFIFIKNEILCLYINY